MESDVEICFIYIFGDFILIILYNNRCYYNWKICRKRCFCSNRICI